MALTLQHCIAIRIRHTKEIYLASAVNGTNLHAMVCAKDVILRKLADYVDVPLLIRKLKILGVAADKHKYIENAHS